MSQRILIRNGRVIDPANGVDGIHSLALAGNRLIAIDDTPSDFRADALIDATGCLVIPGLVDLAARLREPGHEHKATIETETRAAAAGGITTLCCPPDTKPVIDAPAEVELLRRRAKQAGHAWVVPIGALTQGLLGEHLAEMAALKAEGCAGVSNALMPIRDTRVLLRGLEYAATFDLTVFVQPLNPWLGFEGCAHDGAVATRLGLPAIPDAAETAEIALVLDLAEHTGARIHFCRLSCARSVQLIERAQRAGLPVTADVSAHQLFLTENDLLGFDSQAHVMPPLRTDHDRDTLRRAVASGVITAICSDHQPHELDAKNAPFVETEPGISALETLLPLTLRLVTEGYLDLGRAIEALTSAPARILNRPIGTLTPGARADVGIIEPEHVWRLDREQLLSRGHNTPFHGWEFTGRVRQTLFEGRGVFHHPAAP
jgi:dihydroorotase